MRTAQSRSLVDKAGGRAVRCGSPCRAPQKKSPVKKTIAKLDVKQRRVEAGITAARRAVHERGGVKSMLLELARNM